MFDDAVIIGLGSNLRGGYASCESVLRDALGRFPDLGIQVSRKSRVWVSRAWPDPNEPDYRNIVVIVETLLEAGQVMLALHQIEADFGRERGKVNASRVLDLDLIAYGRQLAPDLSPCLPHPRAHERRFVMGPLAEIAPDWSHPALGRTARDLAASARIGADARPLGGGGRR